MHAEREIRLVGMVVRSRRINVEHVVSIINRDCWSSMPTGILAAYSANVPMYEVTIVIGASPVPADEDVGDSRRCPRHTPVDSLGHGIIKVESYQRPWGVDLCLIFDAALAALKALEPRVT